MRRFFQAGTLIIAILSHLGCGRSTAYYIQKGNRFFDSRKYQDAALQYRKALQGDPGSAEAYYRLGLAEVEQKSFPNAYAALSQAVNLAPSNDAAMAKLGDISALLYLSDPNHPKAIYDQLQTMANRLLARNPESFDGLRLSGTLRLFDRKPKEAIEYFGKANRIAPVGRDAMLSWTQALFQDGQFHQGERMALELIAKQPSLGPIYDVLYHEYRSANRLADAENVLKLKAANNPTQPDYIVQLAQFYAAAKRPTEMNAAIQRLTNDPKAFPRGYIIAGDFYARMGDAQQAMDRFEEGARRNPKEKAAYQKKIADLLLVQGKREEAAQLVNSILKENPNDEEARRVRAALRTERGKPEDLDAALAEFASLEKEAPDDAALHFNYARAWLARGETEKGRAELAEALRARPDYTRALNTAAAVAFEQQRPAEALGYAQRLLSYEPTNRNAQLLVVASLGTLGRFEDAHAALNAFLRAFPNDPALQMQGAFLAIAEKKYAEAERIFQRLYRSGQGDPRAGVGLAEAYTAENQLEKALQLLDEGLERTPDSSTLLSLEAFVAGRAGKFDAAAAAYRRLLAREPSSADLHSRLALVYQSKGDYASAIPILEEAAKLAPRDSRPAVLLGISLENTGQIEPAKLSYRRALQLRPDDPMALNDLSYLLARTGGDLDEALRLSQRALQKAPGQRSFIDTLGFIYLKKGMSDSAIQTFNFLVRQNPENPKFHYHLGQALLYKGDKLSARREFENALANHASQEDAAKLKELLEGMRG